MNVVSCWSVPGELVTGRGTLRALGSVCWKRYVLKKQTGRYTYSVTCIVLKLILLFNNVDTHRHLHGFCVWYRPLLDLMICMLSTMQMNINEICAL